MKTKHTLSLQLLILIYIKTYLLLPLALLATAFNVSAQQTVNWKKTDTKLPSGDKFVFWQDETSYTQTYYVAQNNPQASDQNDGTKQKPFKTIGRAAELLQPGQQVVIYKGTYRETIEPARGGTDAKHMIAYRAAENEEVIVKGSVVLQPNRWTASTDFWQFYKKKAGDQTPQEANKALNIWQYTFEGDEFEGYNPFGLINILLDREWLDIKRANLTHQLMRRGLLFANGRRLTQVEKLKSLSDSLKSNETLPFWIEHNGMSFSCAATRR